jgi:hypothetical protein
MAFRIVLHSNKEASKTIGGAHHAETSSARTNSPFSSNEIATFRKARAWHNWFSNEMELGPTTCTPDQL